MGKCKSIGIRACYDEGKRAAETLFFDFWRQYDVEIKVARIFNTYGPRMSVNDGRVVSNFAVQALLGNPITIFGDGSQTRSFCYVSDLIPGLIKLMNSPEHITGPINLGNPTEFSISDLAEKILYLTSSNSKLIFQDLPADDPKQRKPDISLAMQLLDWMPSVNIEEGLVETINYFKTQVAI